MVDPEQAVETLEQKIRDGERAIVHERDRDALLAFLREMQLMRETYGYHRQVKLLRHCVRMAEESGASIADALEDKAAAEEIVRWIHSEYDLDESPETNQNYRVALRVFGRRVSDDNGDEPPESIDWIKSTLPRDYDPSPDPTEMLEWESDIEPMLDAARNPRDSAAIALQFDAGLRGGELYELTVGDITDTEHGLSVAVDGKTGQRAVDLIPSTPYVTEWLTKHPGDGNDPIWCRLTSREQLSYQSYLDMFKRPADRAGVTKDVTPTNFRKSNLAWLARQGMNARYIERRQGRTHGSDAVARYVAVFDADIGDEYARLMGLDVRDEDESDEFRPVTCPRCDRETPRDEDLCMWCGMALDPDAADRVSDAKTAAVDELTADEEWAQQFGEAIFAKLENDPEFAAKLLSEVEGEL